MRETGEDLGLLRLETIHKLMLMYGVGTGKPENHKDDKGDYEVIFFIKEALNQLRMRSKNPVYEIPDYFIEEFFIEFFRNKKD